MIKRWLYFWTLFSFSTCLHGHWEHLHSGLDYTKLTFLSTSGRTGTLHAFRIDPTQYTLAMVLAKDEGLTVASVETLKKDNDIAINGGFFSVDKKPLGLRITQGEVKAPLKNITWWHIFHIEKDLPMISSLKEYINSPNTSFAIQAGPRLIKHNHILDNLKEGYAERSAIGVTPEGKIILAATENAPISTNMLAHLMLKLGCKEALNLDGGNSTQLYAHIQNFEISRPGFSKVSDAIVVHPKIP